MYMTNTYTDGGQALYNLISQIDITAIYPEGWGTSFNHRLKMEQDDGLNPLHPYFTVAGLRDEVSTLDMATDRDLVTFAITFYDSFASASQAEANLRALADLVRNRVRVERISPNPVEIAFHALLGGEWGGSPETGEIFYQMNVQLQVSQELVP